jgi:putative hydrolase of the HAD superfamily
MPDSVARMQAERRENSQAVLLDALGTLVWLEPPPPLLRAELARRFGVVVALQDAERAIAAEVAFYRAHLDDGRDRASLAALRSSCAEVIRDALADERSLAAVDNGALTEALLASLRFRAFADVRPALTRWRARGVRLVVVSNWDLSLHQVLARLGIAPLLDGIVTSAQAGVRKPAREIFEQALRLAGAGASEATHVGDSLEEDVAGARRAGIEPVLLRRDGRAAPRGVRTIASLTELETLAP